jgi:sialic acid synthase SpsE
MRALLIAEAGINHGGSVARAKAMCASAKEAGADVVKFQHYRPKLILGVRHPAYAEASKAQLSVAEHAEIKAFCDEIDIEYCCSLFHPDDVPKWEDMGVKRYKVASRVAGDTNLLSAINRTKKPVIISVGMSTKKQIERALDWTDSCNQTLLHCICKYPADLRDFWPGDMDRLKEVWKVKVGLSSHCPSIAPSVLFAARGATVIEQHVCDSRTETGCDIPASITFDEFKQMSTLIRAMEACDGNVAVSV